MYLVILEIKAILHSFLSLFSSQIIELFVIPTGSLHYFILFFKYRMQNLLNNTILTYSEMMVMMI